MARERVRQGQIPELGERACAIDEGSLLLLAVEGLHGGEQHEQGVGQPFPGQDGDDGGQRMVGEDVGGVEADEAE